MNITVNANPQTLAFEVNPDFFICNFKTQDGNRFRGEVYSGIQSADGDEYWYQRADGPGDTDDKNQARKLFEFSFVWKGVWEGRIYFTDDEYWSEEMATMAEAWAKVQGKMQKQIRENHPDYDWEMLER